MLHLRSPETEPNGRLYIDEKAKFIISPIPSILTGLLLVVRSQCIRNRNACRGMESFVGDAASSATEVNPTPRASRRRRRTHRCATAQLGRSLWAVLKDAWPPCTCPRPPRPFPGWPVLLPLPVPGTGSNAGAGTGIDCVAPPVSCGDFVMGNETDTLTPTSECCSGLAAFLRTSSAVAVPAQSFPGDLQWQISRMSK